MMTQQPSTSELYNLRWNCYSSNLIKVFADHQSNEKLVDVTLSCEGNFINVHRLVLSACSSYFQEIFEKHTAPQLVILLNDIKFSDLELVVQFMYRGEVKVADCDLQHFLALGRMLRVKGICSVELKDNSNGKVASETTSTNENAKSTETQTDTAVGPSKVGGTQQTNSTKRKVSSPTRKKRQKRSSDDLSSSHSSSDDLNTDRLMQNLESSVRDSDNEIPPNRKKKQPSALISEPTDSPETNNTEVPRSNITDVPVDPSTIAIDARKNRIKVLKSNNADSLKSKNSEALESRKNEIPKSDARSDSEISGAKLHFNENGNRTSVDQKEKIIQTTITTSHIPRPPNAFMIFANQWRKKLTVENPGESNKEISVRLGNMWKSISPETKEAFYEEARQAEKEHKLKYPGYSPLQKESGTPRMTSNIFKPYRTMDALSFVNIEINETSNDDLVEIKFEPDSD